MILHAQDGYDYSATFVPSVDVRYSPLKIISMLRFMHATSQPSCICLHWRLQRAKMPVGVFLFFLFFFLLCPILNATLVSEN